MADRPKLPKSIVVLNIIMAVVLLAICALAVALFVQAKDLGWSLPTPDSSPVSSAASNADAAGSDTAGSDTAETSRDDGAITVQAHTAE